jgi:hypothetical protein
MKKHVLDLLSAGVLLAVSVPLPAQEEWKDRLYLATDPTPFANGLSAPVLGKAFFLSESEPTTLIEVDLAAASTGRMLRFQRFEGGAHGADLVSGTGHAWILGQDPGSDARLIEIDLSTMERLQTHVLPGTGQAGLVSSLVIDELRNAAFFLDGFNDLRRVDLQDGALSAPLAVPDTTVFDLILPNDNQSLYLVGEGSISRLDPVELSEQAVNASIHRAAAAALHPDGASILVFENQADSRTFRKYSSDTLELEGELSVEGSFGPSERVGQILFESSGRIAYAFPRSRGEITKIDVDRMELIARSISPGPPSNVDFDFVTHATLAESDGTILLGQPQGLRQVSSETLGWLGDIETPSNENRLNAGALVDNDERLTVGVSVGDFGRNGRILDIRLPEMVRVDQVDLGELESTLIDLSPDPISGNLLAAYVTLGFESGIVRVARSPLSRIDAHHFENVRFRDIAYDFTHRDGFFVSDQGQVGRISLDTFERVATQDFGALDPAFLWIDSDRRLGYVPGARGVTDVVKFDLESLTMVDSVALDLDLGPVAWSIATAVFRPERNRGFIGINASAFDVSPLVEISLEPMEVLRSIDMPEDWNFEASTLNPDGTKAFFSRYSDSFSLDRIAVVDLESLSIERIIRIPERIVDSNHESTFLVMDPEGVNLFSARDPRDRGSAAIDRFDVETLFRDSFEQLHQ